MLLKFMVILSLIASVPAFANPTGSGCRTLAFQAAKKLYYLNEGSFSRMPTGSLVSTSNSESGTIYVYDFDFGDILYRIQTIDSQGRKSDCQVIGFSLPNAG